MTTMSEQSNLSSSSRTGSLRLGLMARLKRLRELEQRSPNSEGQDSEEDEFEVMLEQLLLQCEENELRSRRENTENQDQLQTEPDDETVDVNERSLAANSGRGPGRDCHEEGQVQVDFREGNTADSYQAKYSSRQPSRKIVPKEVKPPDPGQGGINQIRTMFVQRIDPQAILHFFHKYDSNVLSQADMEKITAQTTTNGRSAGAQVLLEALPRYKHWWWCLLTVLRDPAVKQRHLANEFEKTLEEQSSADEDTICDATNIQISFSEEPLPAVTEHLKDTRSEKDRLGKTRGLQQVVVSSPRKNLLLLGKTGEGKSATGNSILGSVAFKSACSTSPVTERLDMQFCNHDQRNLMIVDSPGLFDAESSGGNAEQVAVQILAEVILTVPEGYDAILMVLKCGSRFKEEDLQTLKLLRQIFGKDFISNYCVLVLTHVDVFTRDNDMSVEEWVREQRGHFKDMLEEMKNRVVFFDNKTTDEFTKQAQIKSLMNMVEKTVQSRYTYRNTAFRDAICQEGKQTSLCRNALIEIKFILREIKKMRKMRELDLQHEMSQSLAKQSSDLCKKADLLNKLHDLDVSEKRELYSGIKSIIEVLAEETDSFCSKLGALRDKMRNVMSGDPAEEILQTEYAELMIQYKHTQRGLKREVLKMDLKSKKNITDILLCYFDYILLTLAVALGTDFVKPHHRKARDFMSSTRQELV